MIFLAAVAAGLFVVLDYSLVGTSLPGWVYAGGADGAYALLSTIAGSTVTVAGLGFSITIVALVLASTQFGPRLLTLFVRDRISQLTLGTFAGTFTFCLLTLRSIRGETDLEPAFVPQLSITVAIGLTLLSVGVLVYFFHHVAVSIQAPKVAAAVARDLDVAIDHLYPGSIGHGGSEPVHSEVPAPEGDRVIAAHRSGYVQVVDDAALMATAIEGDVCVNLLTRPGLFVVRDNPIVAVRGQLSREIEDRLRSAVIIGDVRTPEDDIEYSVRQLVEIALRSLSPAINDPFTAMTAIDWLGAALARMAQTDFPSRYRYDDGGSPASRSQRFDLRRHCPHDFSRIRHYGGSSPMVLNRLLEAVAAFGPHIKTEEDRAVVRAETESVMAMGHSLVTNETDLAELDRRYRAAVAALAQTA